MNETLKIWYDWEFSENGPDTPLEWISVGMTDEDGRSYYAVNADLDRNKVNDWVRTNVLPQLPSDPHDPAYKTRAELKADLLAFVGSRIPELWGYYPAYDHVLLAQTFGAMIDLPKGWPMYTKDIKQWCDSLGNPKLPAQGKGEHHALADAIWTKQAWYWLDSLATTHDNEFLAYKARAEAAESLLLDVQQECIALRRSQAVPLG